MPKFKNKNGTNTRYAFACGYIEQAEKSNIRVSLWLDGIWHVRAHDFTNGRIFWDCFDTLTPARARYRQAVKQYVKGAAE